MRFEFFEVEDRPVVVSIVGNSGQAWVWRDGRWRNAPGLFIKSALEGMELSREAFVEQFPEANLAALTA
ncbi:MAG: hypothetical protein JSR28_16625 [Proteobacteria bacterium]|nr:hypothetical protein [Pseudomonadota bacterium]